MSKRRQKSGTRPRATVKGRMLLQAHPSAVRPTERIVVRGSGWGAGAVSLLIDQNPVSPARVLQGFAQLGQVKPDSSGTFVALIGIDDNVEAGSHVLRAVRRGSQGEREATAQLEIIGSVVVGQQRSAADAADEEEGKGGPRLRNRHLLLQRFGTSLSIPPGVRGRAWADVERMKQALSTMERGQPVIPGCNWTPVGASVVSNGQLYETATTGRTAPVSGRVTSLAIDPNDPDNTVFIGTAQGGVWKTSDGGQTWLPKTDFAFSLAIGAVTIDASLTDISGRSRRIYAGTGEENFGGDSYYGGGILRSDDSGETWTQLAAISFQRDTISRIIVDPTEDQHLYLTSSKGAFESHNAEGSWDLLRAGLATDLALDASKPTRHRLYAAFYGDGIYRRIDMERWTLLKSPALPNPAPGRIALGQAPGAPLTMYAAFAAGPKGNDALQGLYKTTDGGDIWSLLPFPNPTGVSQTFYNLVLAVDPRSPDIVYFGEVQLWRSVNGGASWNAVTTGSPAGQPGIHSDQHAIAFRPTTGGTVWVGNDGGVWVSPDGGTNWSHRNRGLQTMQYYTLAQHHTFDAVLLAGSQDNGAQRFAGHPAWTNSALGDGGYTAIDPYPYHPLNMHWYEGRYSPYSVFRSDQAGEPGSWVLKTNGISVTDRYLFYAPFTVDPFTAGLFFGPHRLYYSYNYRTKWWPITGDLTAGHGPLGAISAISRLIWTDRDTYVYVGTADGRFWQVHQTFPTSDTTPWLKPWTTTDRSAGLPGVYIADIAAHPIDHNTLYVAVSGLLLGIFPPEVGIDHVWRSSNGGATWINIATAPSRANAAHIIAIDAEAPNRIFIGCDLGLFRSEDQGTTWVPWDQGLPNVAVLDLEIHTPSRLMRAATHGRGVWERPIDAATCRAVDIYVRDTLLDTGRRPTPVWDPDPLHPPPSDPLSGILSPFPPYDLMAWYCSVDIKVDSPDPTTGHYQTPTAALDYLAFGTLRGMLPHRGRTSRVSLQGHNRVVQAATQSKPALPSNKPVSHSPLLPCLPLPPPHTPF